MFKLDWEKTKNQRSHCQHPLDHWKSKGIPEKYLVLLIHYTKAADYVNHNKLWKIQEMGHLLAASWEICMQVKKQQLELDMEQTGSKLGKDYVKAVYCHLI